ncbi:MAG: RHS repeat-associated core domain-containing protein [Thermoanaerobaculia bacterium]
MNPGSLQAIYTYDKMDRPVTLQSKEGAATAVYVVKNSPLATYRAYGPLSTLRFDLATDRDETRAYDFRNQPTSITVSGSLFTLNYTTDDVGNITQQQRTLPAPTETRGYSYQDWQYYLTCGSGPWGGTACSPSPSGNPLQWTYDKIGNRATELRAGLTDGYVYDPNSGATGDTAVLDVVNLGVMGTRDYTFDAGGYLNQIAAGANVLDFTFDDAGQLAEVERTAASQDLTMSYDGRGFLAEADDAASGGSVKATYSSGGLLHYSLERKPTSVATVERHNVLYFAGRPIAIWKKVGAAAATTTYLVTDHLGTPVYALNQAGTEYWKGGLEPFGRDWQEGTANDMLTKGIFLRFPGQWDDGLFTNATLGADSYYNFHRWYEDQTGKYSSADPLGLRGSINAFAYTDGNPVGFVDPLGLKVELYCETIGRDAAANVGHRIVGAAGFQHCFVRIKCNSCPKYDLRLEVNGRDNEAGMSEIPDPPRFGMGHGASIVPFDSPDWDSNDCTMEECILKRYRELQSRGYDYGFPPKGWLFGPNSNTFANDILTSCGVRKVYWPDGVAPFNY